MIDKLTFGIPDARKYPCLGLALDAGRRGVTYPAVLGAADEVAVSNFLAGHLSYPGIAHVIEDALSAHSGNSNPSLDQVLEADSWARKYAEERVKRLVRS
jgi:1-deoxy-D-xylulose-5-phosphate reductoisomerase